MTSNSRLRQLKIAISMLLIFSFITGIVYPLVITGIAQLFFPFRANGSLIKREGKIIGSILIGQSFTRPEYFWSRPSATTPYAYNAINSSGSNFGPGNPAFLSILQQRVAWLQQTTPRPNSLIPVDLVTASASGLDPHISPISAFYQAERIAKARNLPVNEIEDLIRQHVYYSTCNLFGEPRVNVLKLNMELDKLK